MHACIYCASTGVPPKDLLEAIAQAYIANGYNVDDCLKRACSVTSEWKYDGQTARLKDRIQPKFTNERSIPLKKRTLDETLNPQPEGHRRHQDIVELDRPGRLSLAERGSKAGVRDGEWRTDLP